MIIELPSPRAVVEDRFLLAWNMGATIVFILPLLTYVIARATHNNEEDGDQQQEENENDQYRNPWWKFWASNNNNNGEEGDGNRDDEREGGVPWWWFSGGERDPEDEGKGSITFVYLWTIFIFIIIVVYGNSILHRSEHVGGLVSALLMMGNLCFLCCILLASLEAIAVEGRELEETGWYGQFSVCLFLTCVFIIIYCLSFLFLIYRQTNSSTKSDDNSSIGYRMEGWLGSSSQQQQQHQDQQQQQSSQDGRKPNETTTSFTQSFFRFSDKENV